MVCSFIKKKIALTSFLLKNSSFISKPVSAVETQALRNKTIEQTMEKLPNGTRRLAAQLRSSVGFEALWTILTDYSHLSDFIPNLSTSRLISRKSNRVQLQQVGSQRLMGFRFSAEVLIELVEDHKNGLLQFHLLKGDFRRFEGAWKIGELPNGEGSSLLYELTVQGCIGMPVAFIEQRLRQDLNTNLLAVERAAIKKDSIL